MELKKPHGKYLKKVILEGPFQMPTETVPGDPTAVPPRPDTITIVPLSRLTPEQLLHLEADELAMQQILLGIPNQIYKSIDAQTTAKAMWEQIHLLMEGTELSKIDMESKLYHNFDVFTIEPGESLESYYHRFTNVVNDLHRHKIDLPTIAINTKFLNSLGPDWHKYVTFVRQVKDLHDVKYGLLYDYLKHHQYEVLKDKEARGTHGFPQPPIADQIALMAHGYPTPYPKSNHAFDQQQRHFSYAPPTPSHQLTPEGDTNTAYSAQINDDQVDAFEALNHGMTFIAKAFSKFSTQSNNRLRSSSNPKSHAVIQGGKVEVQNRTSGRRMITSGYSGNSGNGQTSAGGSGNNNFKRNIQVVETGNSPASGSTIRCYNCKKQGHLANACPEPRTRGGDYYKQVMLMAYKDEAGGELSETQQGFMADTLSDDEYEDLEANAAVVLMANMQEHYISQTENGPVYDTDGLSQE